MKKNKMLKKGINPILRATSQCWCHFCEGNIKKGDLYARADKGAWKGSVRINICRDCLIKSIIKMDITQEEIKKKKKELVADELQK